MTEFGNLSLKMKDLSWDNSVKDSMNDRRKSSIALGGQEGEPSRLQDDIGPPMSIEERLAMLEREVAQLTTNTAPTRTFSEYGQEQISELDFPHYVPENKIVRISSEEWHEKRGGKFAVPEASVLTVSTTSRHWAGRHVMNEVQNDSKDVREDKTPSLVPMADRAPEPPYRVAISGFELHRALEQTFGLPVSLNNNVWIWPFKHFITYENQIRNRLRVQENLVEEREKGIRLLADDDKGITKAVQVLPLEKYRFDTTEDRADEEDYEKAVRLRDQLRCLVQFMDEDMKDLFAVKKQIANGTLKKISFEYLWLLYKPGDVVFSGFSQRRAYRVLHVTGGRAILDIGDQPSINNHNVSQPVRSWEQHEDQAVTYAHSKNTPFVIDCYYIDFDGENFGPVPRKFAIQEYEGEQDIDTLQPFPTKFDKNLEETEKMLIKRGKRFVKLARASHKKYTGLSAREPSVADSQEDVNSDVVIDFAEAIKKFQKDKPSWEVGLGAGVVSQASKADRREINEIKPCATKGCTLCKKSDIFDDSYHDLEKRSDYMDNTTTLRYRAYGKEELDTDQILLLPPRVYGYSLLDRYWYPLNIDRVEDIKTSAHNGFDDLVLPGDHKRIMQALVKHHTRGSRPTSGKDRAATDLSMDLVRGKGRGLIILLHGVPGVGKTSTAECVAAQTKRPLFPITCGDIGTTASEVEERLESYFDLAHKWGCVLLLDEADVYLASRERGGDLQRNSLVSGKLCILPSWGDEDLGRSLIGQSLLYPLNYYVLTKIDTVFLRVLEYYSGILILTTNRVGEFDEAFKSRIHISLYYPKLDRESTLKIWEMNIKRIQRSGHNIDVEEDKIKKFAQSHWSAGKKKLTRRWNGRQIKNAFQTAIALATWDFNDESESESEHLERPLLTEKHFKIVSQTSAHFDDYLSNVHGIDEDDAFAVIAEREALRKEDVPSSVNWGRKRGPSPEFRSKGGRRSIHRSSRQYDSEDEVAPDDDTGAEEDDHETQIQEMEMKLQKMKNRRKISTKEVTYGSREKTKEMDGKGEKSRSRNTRLYESDDESDDD